MLSTNELLDLAKVVQGGVTDYRLSKLLEVSNQHISNYRNNPITPSNPVAIRLAALCGLDPVEVMIWVNLERAKTAPDREAWQMMLDRVSPAKDRRPLRKSDILPKS